MPGEMKSEALGGYAFGGLMTCWEDERFGEECDAKVAMIASDKRNKVKSQRNKFTQTLKSSPLVTDLETNISDERSLCCLACAINFAHQDAELHCFIVVSTGVFRWLSCVTFVFT
jgi:hypothetical protein